MSACSPQEIHDGLIMKGIFDHFNESLERFDESRIVGIFCQGSQNYGLDYENSDIDTKLIVLPTFKDIAFNKKPVSTTHIRANDEHTDEKDLRLYFQTFRKQNLNFLEILFTPYFIVNAEYAEEWHRLVKAREKIARMNPYRAVKSMYGIAQEKYHAMEHPYPSKADVLAKYGYDPKQLHHLLRVQEYLARYIAGESYEDCLRPRHPEYLIEVKRGCYSLESARKLADAALAAVIDTANDFCSKTKEEEDPEVVELLNDVQYNIMRRAIALEFRYDEVYD